MTGEGSNSPKVCLGFDIHYPCYLNPGFRPDTVKRTRDAKDRYFSPNIKEDLGDVIDRSFRPATEILLDILDGGFACALSISGTVVEHLEEWYPETLDLLSRAATHPNVELLAQTYYHSVAGQFADLTEFEAELLMHRDLMKELFSVAPTAFAHADYPITPATAKVLKEAGIRAAVIEGGEGPALERDPNYTYTYRDLPVIVTHCDLADDIAVRFPWRGWDKWPLMADRYAEWLSVSPGDCVTLFLDYRVFGDAIGAETGILEFLRALPSALAGEGIESVHPSVAATFPAHGEIGEATEPKNLQMTILQHSALHALEEARDLVADGNIWRCLLDTDHIRRMAMRSASCGRPLHAVSHQAAHDHFASCMRVLSDFEERSAAGARSRKAVLSLRCVPPEKAFYFSSHERPAGYAAHSLQELLNMLEFAPDDVIRYHVEREDFSRWIDLVIGDENLAKKVSGVADRAELRSTVRKRIERLWNRLK
ncbi:Glycosyl hydrolase family 57 [Methanoculleus chikugoensis]|uniref:Glycosyl hydrolase family 57 n=1 Tax=Methanoculleus chikugoensis TaxID=118126 RepID=A0A1M4MMW2_9EURY|nr:glycoside hydrolase family 57 protein [Methanoculleus chikugoensis]SCL76197.1 Glycosyl hydrolase family 57 [Methanoculleus chikugoensis]